MQFNFFFLFQRLTVNVRPSLKSNDCWIEGRERLCQIHRADGTQKQIRPADSGIRAVVGLQLCEVRLAANRPP